MFFTYSRTSKAGVINSQQVLPASHCISISIAMPDCRL